MSTEEIASSHQCPVCRAPFRGRATCQRCGADLEPLMHVLARAWRLRNEARARLAAGEVEGALDAASEAVSLEDTSEARRIYGLARVLAAAEGSVIRGTR